VGVTNGRKEERHWKRWRWKRGRWKVKDRVRLTKKDRKRGRKRRIGREEDGK